MKRSPIVFPDPEASFASYMRIQEALRKHAARKPQLINLRKLMTTRDGSETRKSRAALIEEIGKPQTANQN
jgi:hypothetical protein